TVSATGECVASARVVSNVVAPGVGTAVCGADESVVARVANSRARSSVVGASSAFSPGVFVFMDSFSNWRGTGANKISSLAIVGRVLGLFKHLFGQTRFLDPPKCRIS